MPSYQPQRLERYEPRFLAIAEDIFDRMRREIPAKQVERHDGSFSVYGRTVKDTAAKIVIYDPQTWTREHLATDEGWCLHLGAGEWPNR